MAYSRVDEDFSDLSVCISNIILPSNFEAKFPFKIHWCNLFDARCRRQELQLKFGVNLLESRGQNALSLWRRRSNWIGYIFEKRISTCNINCFLVIFIKSLDTFERFFLKSQSHESVVIHWADLFLPKLFDRNDGPHWNRPNFGREMGQREEFHEKYRPIEMSRAKGFLFY